MLNFNRTKNLKLSIIKQIELKASKYPNVVSLAQGIPNFDTPECIKDKVKKAMQDKLVAKYSLSPGLPELRKLIQKSLAKENMFYDWEKEIIVTAGTIEGITATILALTNPGDEIIIPEPTYTSYCEVITLAGCKPVFVPLNKEKGWAFEIEKYKKAITPKTKAIFYCNPNNPTGTIYTKEQLLELADLAEKHNLYLISDEVYKDFLFEKDDFIFSLAEVPEIRKRVIRIYGFSKAYAMTGWRVGYVHSDKSLIKEIIKVHDCLVTCAPVISQYGAIGALENGKQDLKKFNQEYKKRRDLICQRLDKLNHIFSYIKPRSSYYVFAQIKENKLTEKNKQGLIDSWKFCLALLDKIQVALVPGFAFGTDANSEGYLRMSFGRSEEDINEAFDRLEKLFLN